MNEEELKKCPQCGGPVKHNDHEIGFMCVACEMDLYEGYAEWWCYKEISHLKSALQELHKEICFLSGALQAKDAEIAELVKALEKINKQCHGDAVVYSRFALAAHKEGTEK